MKEPISPAAFHLWSNWMLILWFASAVSISALDIDSLYSPHNKERPKRKSTKYIILHTTEGPTQGSLQKIYRRGEANYFVDHQGKVKRIIHRSRVAYHAGLSMWNGLTNLDRHSIGIEIVGYHNRNLNSAQYRAAKELLRQLQKIYNVPDERVLTHSMVAYGRKNRWHKSSHRGRKRCGMLFADTSVRGKLGLTKRPSFDPDVKSGRLIVADPFLERRLYGNQQVIAHADESRIAGVITKNRSAWDIAQEKYKSAKTEYIFPDGRRLRGDKIRDWTAIPSGTKVVIYP